MYEASPTLGRHVGTSKTSSVSLITPSFEEQKILMNEYDKKYLSWNQEWHQE